MSKRSDKSNAQAQIVCRELRYQLSNAACWGGERLAGLVIEWMKHTGKKKYDRPPT